jgi:hypothetical protein
MKFEGIPIEICSALVSQVSPISQIMNRIQNEIGDEILENWGMYWMIVAELEEQFPGLRHFGGVG